MPESLLHLTEEIPTPFLLVEEAVVRRNIRRIQSYGDRHGLEVRPHVKTHKSLDIARMQLEAGAAGLSVAKVGEARRMADLGAVDLTVAYPAVGRVRERELAALASTHALRVAVDSDHAMEGLARAALDAGSRIGILVIFDAGLHRCGLTAPRAMVRLAQKADAHPALTFDGVLMYLGHLYGEAARDMNQFKQINALWEPVHAALSAEGLAPRTVSSGSTPSLENTHHISGVTEIRPGASVYYDYCLMHYGHCALHDCAARMVTTVVSSTAAGRVIVDAGSKALSAKSILSHPRLGYVVEYPQARVVKLHEEHGWLETTGCRRAPEVGERLSIVPVNASLCVNLHDAFILVNTDGTVEQKRVHARGRYV